VTQDNKRQLITILIELNLLLDLFLFDNINIKNKTQELIILLYTIDSRGSYNNIITYDKTQLKQFIKLNLKNLFDNSQGLNP
jgi:hypothetical protein